MRGARTNWVLICAALAACNALDEPPTRLKPGPHLIVPTDERPAVQALRTPPPIIGGTLAVTPDGQHAIVADPERDRISIVDLTTRAVQEIALEEGAEPGRVTIDFNGLAHVVLRRAGDVLTLEPVGGAMIARRHACASPRGVVATASATDRIKVVCASGELVTLRATSEGASVVQLPDDDLRDVIDVAGENSLLISRFKSAQLLQVDVDGNIFGSMAVPTLTRSMERIEVGNGEDGPSVPITEFHAMQPQVAWRTAQSPADSSVWMLHQAESQNEIEVTDEPQADGSAYGGSGFSCSGIVQTAISHMNGGQVVESSSIAGVVLAVDMAVSPNGQALAIAQAGRADPGAPVPTTVFINDDGEESGASSGPVANFPGQGAGSVEIIRTSDVPGDGCRFPESIPVNGQATAVAFRPNGEIVVQLREPAMLVVLDDPQVANQFGARAIGEIPLGGESTRDTGHDLFHMNSGAGIACAGCHAEGGDDGHVWNFSTVGARRTQAVNIGLAGTLPLHWDGDMKNLGMIMDKVFVGRMGGVRQSKQRLEVLENWVFSMRPPPAMVAADDEAALRGKELFESGEVGCAGCHNGDALTNNKSYDVGTGAGNELQVPSLHGVGYRAPFIHSGCAPTLAARFDPSCGGGDKHGHTSQLSEEQVGDLVAYLKSL